MSEPTSAAVDHRSIAARFFAAASIFAFLLGRQSATFTGTTSDWIGFVLNAAALASCLYEASKRLRA
jgi:hypothetical protein